MPTLWQKTHAVRVAAVLAADADLEVLAVLRLAGLAALLDAHLDRAGRRPSTSIVWNGSTGRIFSLDVRRHERA